MIAQLIAGNDEKSDDPNQRQKIQQVMDITGKAEEIVATALFDAGWDENLAIGMLLEGGDQLTAWEETGKGGKKKKQQKSQAADDKVHIWVFILKPQANLNISKMISCKNWIILTFCF